MKIAVTGYKGYVGSKLVERGCIPLKCDITNKKQVKDVVGEVSPDVIFHCAAITSVRCCEENVMKAHKVNVEGTGNIISAFPKGHFIYLSTDHVFSGKRWFGTYKETNKPSPVNIYGFTKLGGEVVSGISSCHNIVIRTSKLFNYARLKGEIQELQDGEEKEVTALIKRSFLHLDHFINSLMLVVDMLDNVPDILHIAGLDTMSYADFWKLLARKLGLDEGLIKPRKHKIEACPRPFRAGLNISRSSSKGIPIYDAENGVERLRKEMRDG